MKLILVPTDFNELATAALGHAVEIAKATGAAIRVIYVDRFHPPAEFTAAQADAIVEALAQSRRLAGEELKRYASALVPDSVPLATEVIEGLPVDSIVAEAEEHQADLIVMGTHGRGGLSRVLLGSVAEGVLRQTRRPVLTVRQTAQAVPVRKIACAGEKAAPFADELARQLSAERVSDSGQADLLVACAQDRSLVRRSRIPVLTIRDAG